MTKERLGAGALALGFAIAASAAIVGLAASAQAQTTVVTTHPTNVNGNGKVQGEKRNGDDRIENARVNTNTFYFLVEEADRGRSQGVFTVCDCGNGFDGAAFCQLVTADTDPVSVSSVVAEFEISPTALQEGGRDSLIQRSVSVFETGLNEVGLIDDGGLVCYADVRYRPFSGLELVVCPQNATLTCNGEVEVDGEIVTLRNFRINARNRSASIELPITNTTLLAE